MTIIKPSQISALDLRLFRPNQMERRHSLKVFMTLDIMWALIGLKQQILLSSRPSTNFHLCYHQYFPSRVLFILWGNRCTLILLRYAFMYQKQYDLVSFVQETQMPFLGDFSTQGMHNLERHAIVYLREQKITQHYDLIVFLIDRKTQQTS